MVEGKRARSVKAAGLTSRGISTGIDCEAISRIKCLMHKKTFIDRVFTEGEYAYCLDRRNPARHLTGRFAAKEACLKALGAGLSRGIKWRDIEVVKRDDGSPGLILGGRAKALMGGDRQILLSLSYGAGLAVAFVVIE